MKPAKTGNTYSIEPSVAINNGPYVKYWPNGKVRLEGKFLNNNKSGEWKYYYNTGAIKTIGNYYDGQPALYITGYFKDGDKTEEEVMARVAIKDDTTFREHGHWAYYYYGKNRISMVVNYYFGILDGPATFFDSMGNIRAKGEMKYVWKTPDASRVNSLVRSGFRGIVRPERVLIKDGKWVYYDETGKHIKSIQHYKEGLLDSEFVIYDVATGTIKEQGYYDDGFRVGVWKTFYTTGKLSAEVVYTKSIGRAVCYDSIGDKRIILEGKVDRNKRIGKWTLYYADNHAVEAIETYKDNLLHGEIVYYDELGNLVSEINYSEGRMQGTATYYHKGTKDKWVVMHYENDTLSDEATTYYTNGKVKRKLYYKDGKIDNEICYSEDGKNIECTLFYIAAEFDQDISTYIGNNLEYPVEARQLKLEGKVKIGFNIDEYGSVKDPVIIEGFDGRCDEEALKLVSRMPKWKPAMLEDIPIASYKVLPVVFWLRPDDTVEATGVTD